MDRGNNQRNEIAGKTTVRLAACRGKNGRLNHLFRIIPAGQKYVYDYVDIAPFNDKWRENMDN
jgi:hypothetical protein